MLTVEGLAREMGLELRSARAAAEVPVRWVHITELPDPTPWLSGGELLLTTGIKLRTPGEQRAFVRRLAEHQLAGLGFGTGFDHDALPPALVTEADRLAFPVFEVPFELPFIAITEKAFTRLVNEQYGVLRRGIAIHKRLERIVLEQRGLAELVRALAAAIGGSVLVLDARGEPIASSAFRRAFPAAALGELQREVSERGRRARSDGPRSPAAPFAPDHPEIAGRTLALPVAVRAGGAPEAWLAAARDAGGLGDVERLVLQQGVMVVALELMRQRVMRDTERRLAGDVLAEAVSGALDPQELAGRLRPFGVIGDATVLVFELDDPAAAEPALDRFLSTAGAPGLVATGMGLLCAVVAIDGGEPLELATGAQRALAERHGGVRAAVSRPAPVTALRRAFHEARCVLEASAIAAPDAGRPDVASYRDLGAFQLLLSLQDDEALRLYCESVLDPLEHDERDGRASGLGGDELMRSLEAYIEHNGHWESAARQLFCHRHTLRYRIRRIEELTGRDLRRARDRIEFWLALRGRELLR